MDQSSPVRTGLDPLTALGRRWKLAVALVVAGALAGLLVASFIPVSTTAEARAAVGTEDLASYEVGGYAVAAAQLAANYARYVNDSPTAQQVLEDELGEDVDQVSSIVSSPIPDSNVVRVEVTADSPEVALTSAQALTEALVERSGAGAGNDQGKLLRRVSRLSNDIVEKREELLQLGRIDGQPLMTPEERQAQAELDTLTAQRDAFSVAFQQTLTAPPVANELTLIQEAAVSGDSASRTTQLFVVAGALLGIGLALLLANVGNGRRRTDTDNRTTRDEEQPA